VQLITRFSLEKTGEDHVAPGCAAIHLLFRDSEGRTRAARNGVVEIP
jgi:hypothetical protein